MKGNNFRACEHCSNLQSESLLLFSSSSLSGAAKSSKRGFNCVICIIYFIKKWMPNIFFPISFCKDVCLLTGGGFWSTSGGIYKWPYRIFLLGGQTAEGQKHLHLYQPVYLNSMCLLLELCYDTTSIHLLITEENKRGLTVGTPVCNVPSGVPYAPLTPRLWRLTLRLDHFLSFGSALTLLLYVTVYWQMICCIIIKHSLVWAVYFHQHQSNVNMCYYHWPWWDGGSFVAFCF